MAAMTSSIGPSNPVAAREVEAWRSLRSETANDSSLGIASVSI